jgi:hypothetical protein
MTRRLSHAETTCALERLRGTYHRAPPRNVLRYALWGLFFVAAMLYAYSAPNVATIAGGLATAVIIIAVSRFAAYRRAGEKLVIDPPIVAVDRVNRAREFLGRDVRELTVIMRGENVVAFGLPADGRSHLIATAKWQGMAEAIESAICLESSGRESRDQ